MCDPYDFQRSTDVFNFRHAKLKIQSFQQNISKFAFECIEMKQTSVTLTKCVFSGMHLFI